VEKHTYDKQIGTSQKDTTNTCTPSGTAATLPNLHNI